MTDLTMARRRADFEAMLERANRIVQAGRFNPPAPPEPPGRLLATLASDVADLTAVWAECVQAVRDGEAPTRVSTRAAMKALTVAARCLQGLDGTGWTTPEALDFIIEDCAVYCWEGSDGNLNHLDLATEPNVRVQNLIVSLGYVAEWWPIKVSTTINRDTLMEQQTSLSHLAFEAVCAALAAERGLWQEEES